MTVPPPHDQPQQWQQNQPQQWQQPTPGSSWGPGGQQGVAAPPPSTRSRTSRGRNTLLGVVAGILVSALVVGGLTLANVVHWGSSSTSADSRAVDLPETLAGLTDVGKAAAAKDTTGGATALVERYQRTYTRTAERYSTAFDGAGAGVRTYTNDGLEFFLTVVAVRADSSGLINGPQADPADLRVVAAPNIFDLVVDGDVQCLQTVNRTVTEGSEVKDEYLLTTVCRTTAAGLTVYVFGGSGNEGSEGKQRMVDLARAAKGVVAGS